MDSVALCLLTKDKVYRHRLLGILETMVWTDIYMVNIHRGVEFSVLPGSCSSEFACQEHVTKLQLMVR